MKILIAAALAMLGPGLSHGQGGPAADSAGGSFAPWPSRPGEGYGSQPCGAGGHACSEAPSGGACYGDFCEGHPPNQTMMDEAGAQAAAVSRICSDGGSSCVPLCTGCSVTQRPDGRYFTKPDGATVKWEQCAECRQYDQKLEQKVKLAALVKEAKEKLGEEAVNKAIAQSGMFSPAVLQQMLKAHADKQAGQKAGSKSSASGQLAASGGDAVTGGGAGAGGGTDAIVDGAMNALNCDGCIADSDEAAAAPEIASWDAKETASQGVDASGSLASLPQSIDASKAVRELQQSGSAAARQDPGAGGGLFGLNFNLKKIYDAFFDKSAAAATGDVVTQTDGTPNTGTPVFQEKKK